MQELSRKQIRDCLAEAIRRQVPVCLTWRVGADWHSLHTRILRRSPEGLWLEYTECEDSPAPGMVRGVELGLSFKLKHHKHIFTTVLRAVGELGLAGAEEVRTLCVAGPQRMQRVQRRAYHRVEVPRNRSVLATFWQGGLSAVEGTGEGRLTWEGWVTNISAGGFQVRIPSRGAPELDVGDLVGVRIDLGQEYQPVLTDAQFRQQTTDERGLTRQGFRFIGLNETATGREMLHRVSTIVCEFQRLQGRRRSSVA